MNQNPTPDKKPPAPQPQWNPYYRRNPDGTPGGRDRTLRENAARAEDGARQVRDRQNALRSNARQTPPSPAPREGLGQPVRTGESNPANRARPAGQSEPMPARKAPAKQPQKPAEKDGARYRRNSDGTMSRVYPRNNSRAAVRRNRKLLLVAVTLLLSVALIIGIVAIIRGISPKIVYTYNYNDQYEVEIAGEEAMPGDHPYVNMNYLAAI